MFNPLINERTMKTYIKPACEIMEFGSKDQLMKPLVGSPVKQFRFVPGAEIDPINADAIGRRNSWGQGIDW